MTPSEREQSRAKALAAEYEQELREHPEARDEIIFELALAYRNAGDPDAAERVLREVVSDGGLPALHARVDLAEMYLLAGRPDACDEELTAVRRSRHPDPWPYVHTAEMLAEHGRLREALRWFDIAVLRMENLETQAPESPDLAYIGTLLWQRRDLRRELGLAPDGLDEVAPATPDFSSLL